MAKKLKPIPGFPEETETAQTVETAADLPVSGESTVVAVPDGFVISKTDAPFVIEALDEHFTRRVAIEGRSAEPLKNKADALVTELKAYVGQS